MKINRTSFRKLTLEEFADSQGLSLDVYENEDGYFLVKFSDTLLKDGHFLVGCQGEGETEEFAIKNYITVVADKILSFYDRQTGKSREIYVPRLKESD